ncbi:dihydroxyacetone kinase subunit DhaL, partial [Pseudonocardia halophobica]
MTTQQELLAWVREFARQVTEHRDELTALDSAIGDADHGANMARGMGAAVEALHADPQTTAGGVFKKVGMTLVSKVGGASGPLYGTLFLRFGTAAGEVTELDPAGFAKAFRAGLEGVVARGRPEAGDKTMYDALAPALDALDESLAGGASLGDALRAAS